MPRLPAEYQEVEWIHSSGTQYFNTGFNPNQDTSVEMKFAISTTQTGNGFFFVGRNAGENNTFGVGKVNGYFRHDYKTSQTVTSTLTSYSIPYKIYADKNVLYINETLIDIATYSNFQSSYPLILLASQENGANTGNFMSGNLYYCKVWDNGTLIRKLIPCYRKSDSVIGMYDMVNDQFYTNAGTGTFTKGIDVDNVAKVSGAYTRRRVTKLPAEYQEVEYIQSSGSEGTGQFIRTGYKANRVTSIEMKVMPTSLTNNACFYCSRTGSTTATFSCFRIANKLRQDYNTTQQDTGYTISNNTVYTIYSDRNRFYVNGNLVSTLTLSSFQSNYAMLLLASNNGGDSTNIDNCFTGRLYYCKIWNNGHLVRDFVPCYRKSDSVIGLYDIQNNKFYTNSGSGSFTKGSNVDGTIYKEFQIRPSHWEARADRTILYLPLESNATDYSGNNRSTTASGLTYSTYGGVKCAYNSGSGYINLTTSAVNYLIPSTGEATANVRIYRGANETSYNRCIFEWEVQNKIGMNFNIYNSTYYPRLITTGNSDVGGTLGVVGFPLNSRTNVCIRIKSAYVECFMNGEYVGRWGGLNNSGFGAWHSSSEQGCYVLTNRGANSNGAFKGGAREFIYENKYWSDGEIMRYYRYSKAKLGIS